MAVNLTVIRWHKIACAVKDDHSAEFHQLELEDQL